MDNRREISEFLTTRRARVQPEDSGLPAHDSRRRVPGLKREEVALLAGVSVDYYARLERGQLAGVSDAVFDAMRVSMQRGERIELRGFGVFQVKPRKRGIGRNPRTGREVKIPPGRTIRFKPGKDLQNIG